ncbi:MAG: DEAD/DEAH box helicase [Actinomycetota bacterium]
MVDVTSFLDHIRQKPEYRGQIVHQRVLPGKPATFTSPKNRLSEELKGILNQVGISSLYTHQARAIDLVKEGKNVLVTSGTASGKSLCYNLPVIEEILSNRRARALYLFPTKALAQDQMRVLKELDLPFEVATFDGDTPYDKRRDIRRWTSIVLSNPDMLHVGILPYHKQWGNFLLNLKYVVIDEVHVLRGVFGSNVAQLIRRLRRLCHHYGSHPQFIMASATVRNPKELAEKLTGLDVEVVVDDGSPCGKRTWVFWNPPLVDEALGERKSANWEAAWLLGELSKEHVKAIVFSKSRKVSELVLNYVRRILSDRLDIASQIASYRAGYLPSQRRDIERRLFSGELLGVSATNALELGIDVGSLDASIINGFPGTISSTWQQAGRAGRATEESLAIFVAGSDPIDQYYINNPGYFFGRSFEEAIVDLDNLKILGKHLLCAAYELPLSIDDKFYFGESFSVTLDLLTSAGKLKEHKSKWFLSAPGFPARKVNLRSASESVYDIVEEDSGQLLGTIEQTQAFFEVYPGAIYLHQGDPYLVRLLDFENQIALVVKSKGDYYTEPRKDTWIDVVSEIESRRIGDVKLSFGMVDVITHVMGYRKKRSLTGQIIDVVELEMPPLQFQTEAVWLSLPNDIIDRLNFEKHMLAGGIHAIEHAGIAMLPMFAMCDRWDIGGMSTPYHPYTERATIFIYDGFEGGIGIAKRGFWVAEDHLQRTLEVIEQCSCKDGCPSCIQSPKCGNWNDPLDKKAAVKILKDIIKGIRGPRP